MTTWFGLTPNERENAVEETTEILISRAKKGLGPMRYEELYKELTKPPSTPFRSASPLLGDVAARQLDKRLPPITALVVSEVERLPSKGFWPVLEKYGFDVTSEPHSWAMALAWVYAYYYTGNNSH